MLKASVRRRFRDFEAFNEALLSKYPYRLIPRMPPKKFTRKSFLPLSLTSSLMVPAIIASPAFIEQRRRSLKRFILLVVRHPVLAKDEVVKFFLTAGGQVKYSRDAMSNGNHAVISSGSWFQTEGQIQVINRRVFVPSTC